MRPDLRARRGGRRRGEESAVRGDDGACEEGLQGAEGGGEGLVAVREEGGVFAGCGAGAGAGVCVCVRDGLGGVLGAVLPGEGADVVDEEGLEGSGAGEVRGGGEEVGGEGVEGGEEGGGGLGTEDVQVL